MNGKSSQIYIMEESLYFSYFRVNDDLLKYAFWDGLSLNNQAYLRKGPLYALSGSHLGPIRVPFLYFGRPLNIQLL